MTPLDAILAFSFAAALLTLTPGLDTALVLRTAAVEGPRPAMAAGLGISCGTLVWGFVAALGLGAVLAVSEVGYQVLKFAGAAYLVWLGIGMLRAAFRGHPPGHGEPSVADGPQVLAPLPGTAPIGKPPPRSRPAGGRRWLARGLATNLLNPKVGVFYVSFLPQFIPAGVDVVGFSVLLAGIHAVMGIAWFAALVLATRPLAVALARPAVTRCLDGITGAVLVGFGVRLALERRIG